MENLHPNPFCLFQVDDSIINKDLLDIKESGFRFPLPKLPLELIYHILKQLAKECQSKQEFFKSAKSLVHVWSQCYKHEEIQDNKELEKKIFENIQSIMKGCVNLAFKQGLLTTNDLKLGTFEEFICFLNDHGSHLKTLNLNQFKFPIKELNISKILPLCPHLKNIDFGCFPTDDSVLIALSNLKKLEKLSLSLSQNVTQQGLYALSQIKLKELTICGGSQLQDQDVEFLAKIPTLKALSLNHFTHLTDNALMFLKDCSLTSLSLKENTFTSEGMGKFFSEFKEIQMLVHLNLSNTNCDLHTLVSLSKCKGLKTLELDYCKNLRDQGFEHLIDLLLEKLSMYGCSNITDQALSSIGNMMQLQNLTLSHCTKITDHGIEKLNAPSLRIVDLSGCHQLTLKTTTFFDRERIESLKLTSCHHIKSQKMELNHLQIIDPKYLTFKAKGSKPTVDCFAND